MMKFIPVKKKGEIRNNLKRARNYLFQVKLSPVILFKISLRHRKPKPLKLLLRDCTYSKATPGLIEEIFSEDPKRIKRFKLYLKCGSVGYLLYNEETWIGYTWSIKLSFREKRLFGKERPYTFVSIPKDYTVEDKAYYGFAAEVRPRYRGKGVFIYLINKSHEWLQSEAPDGVVYSTVEVDNAPSVKTKLMMGEEPLGRFYSMHARILGKYLPNIYVSALTDDTLPEMEKQLL